ncbi:MAG: helicase [Sulfurimonas sp.]|nr:MAG: helicase [Sulfurimonas sp.]
MSNTSKKKYFDNVSVGARTKQSLYYVQQHDKATMLGLLIKNIQSKQIIILSKNKIGANELSKYLNSLDINALAVHGNHRAEQIKNAAEDFSSKTLNILITTDMILKSLELSNIQIIINYDLPLLAADYFVRLLNVDEIGEAISFVSPQEEKTLASIEFMMKLEIPEEKITGFQVTKAPLNNSPKKTKVRHKKAKKDTISNVNKHNYTKKM